MKSVAVFGATSAMAQAAARIWAERGDALYLAARNEEKLEAAVKDLEVRGASDVLHYVVDFADVSGHQALLVDLLQRFPAVDTVLIAYGSLGDQKACEADFGLAVAELNVNLLSVCSLLSGLANHFEERKSGTLAVITSVAGDRGRKSNYVYGTAKGALGIFLQGLRNRLFESGVAVVSIKPGFVDTPMTADMDKGMLFASPEGVAQGIVKAVDSGKDVVYLPWFWRAIMFIIKSVPERVFKRLSL